jgi:hypothetical protein
MGLHFLPLVFNLNLIEFKYLYFIILMTLNSLIPNIIFILNWNHIMFIQEKYNHFSYFFIKYNFFLNLIRNTIFHH